MFQTPEMTCSWHWFWRINGANTLGQQQNRQMDTMPGEQGETSTGMVASIQ